MTKVAIKNENITSFGGIYHIADSSIKCNGVTKVVLVLHSGI